MKKFKMRVAEKEKKFLNSKGITDFDVMPPYSIFDEMIDNLTLPLIQSGMSVIDAQKIIFDAWDEVSN